MGRLPKYDDVEIVAARQVRITGGPDEPVQADGEIVGTLPIVATIDPQPLLVIAPRAQ
jgi:diacylglycerol kinase family enzyme